jgi:hypothetical protein
MLPEPEGGAGVISAGVGVRVAEGMTVGCGVAVSVGRSVAVGARVWVGAAVTEEVWVAAGCSVEGAAVVAWAQAASRPMVNTSNRRANQPYFAFMPATTIP